MSRIDVRPGEDCRLYAKAWSRCKGNSGKQESFWVQMVKDR
ncbi:hypothetical protein [Streptomyces avidinii]|uniref:DUF397 domain-containing protein n=1 Tax=Streptomyces avidinii TaxID=1895 RepID=A0ABS4KW31_STRAV|nr:hypothetical protein [Streptomyces avidinii]MBP2034234.1 hypothetical protein [Streptomyces avidinii]